MGLDDIVTLIKEMDDEVERIKVQRDELADALEFYADPETYSAIMLVPDPPAGQFMDDFSDTAGYSDRVLGRKPGKRARDVIKKLVKELIKYEPTHPWIKDVVEEVKEKQEK